MPCAGASWSLRGCCAPSVPAPITHRPPLLQPVYLVPTAMNYDALLEERSLAAQLAGAAKKSESLAGLAG